MPRRRRAGHAPELSRRDCGRVSDILQMFRIITFSIDHVEKNGTPVDEKLAFELVDDIGPLGTSLGDHRETGLLPIERTPWVTSLHDLETIAQVCDRPSEFLLYLRRRTDTDVGAYYKASDELDLFMLFMNASLYVEPDPDKLRAEHPTIPRVSRQDRKRRAGSAVRTRVGEQCHSLNAWMSREQSPHPYGDDPPPTKPTYNALPGILELIDAIDAHGSGMIRFGADVLALAGDAQRRLLNLINKCVRLAHKDGQPHDGMFSLAGAWGHPTVFVGSRPSSAQLEPIRQRLQAYMHIKRHQMKSDRSYGLLFDEGGNLELAMYINRPVGDDAELDALHQSRRPCARPYAAYALVADCQAGQPAI